MITQTTKYSTVYADMITQTTKYSTVYADMITQTKKYSTVYAAMITQTTKYSTVYALFCLCILHQSYLTITAGTENCPYWGYWVPVYTSFGGSWGL